MSHGEDHDVVGLELGVGVDGIVMASSARAIFSVLVADGGRDQAVNCASQSRAIVAPACPTAWAGDFASMMPDAMMGVSCHPVSVGSASTSDNVKAAMSDLTAAAFIAAMTRGCVRDPGDQHVPMEPILPIPRRTRR